MIRVYVAGPIRGGEPGENIRRAVAVADHLSFIGFAPYVPHLTIFWDMIAPLSTARAMALNDEWLKLCDCVYRLAGDSVGSDAECARARDLGLPVFHDYASLCAWAAEQNAPERDCTSSHRSIGAA